METAPHPFLSHLAFLSSPYFSLVVVFFFSNMCSSLVFHPSLWHKKELEHQEAHPLHHTF